ncbi:MAG: extradiol dioxygenase [Cyclobacteriaceae bacterium]|nr:extradiol dioxygenase [Cyclobacteriaceae bacterium]
MKKQELWLNLPVKDLQKSKDFFLSLGFQSTRDVPGMVGFNIGQVPVMMVAQPDFEKYASHHISDTGRGSELLISVDAPNRAYVDEMAKKINNAGGEIFSGPTEIQVWMYNMGFIDLDGHRWNIVHLDWENMPEE